MVLGAGETTRLNIAQHLGVDFVEGERTWEKQSEGFTSMREERNQLHRGKKYSKAIA